MKHDQIAWFPKLPKYNTRVKRIFTVRIKFLDKLPNQKCRIEITSKLILCAFKEIEGKGLT